MSDPKVTGELLIELDRPCTIKYSYYSMFRLSNYSDDLKRGSHSWGYHQTLIYVWAMLDPADVKRFPNPESLGKYITVDNLEKIMPSILEAVSIAMPSEKKTKSSKRGPSTGGQ